MAAPVIESITPPSLELTRGESKTVVIRAHDPAAQIGTGRAVLEIEDMPGAAVTAAEVSVVLRGVGPVRPRGFPQVIDLPGVVASMTNDGREFRLTLTYPEA